MDRVLRALRAVMEYVFEGPGSRSFPWFLLAYVVVTLYTIFYSLAYNEMYRPAADPADRFGFFVPVDSGSQYGAITIWAVLGFVRVWWLLSWLWAVLLSTKWLAVSGPPPRRVVMQSTGRYWIDEWVHNRNEATTHQRPRFCGRDDCPLPRQQLGDRVYHCTHLEEKSRRDGQARQYHLPLYDHHCHWIRVVVYLDTLKSYLLAILFMTTDAFLVFTISVFAMTHRAYQGAWYHAFVAAFATLVIVYLAGVNTYKRWWNNACRNRVQPEYRNQSRFTIQQPTRDGYDYIFGAFGGNPWNLGTRRNLAAALGVWSCLLFWRQPERVRRYGRQSYNAGRSDFEMSSDFLAWVHQKRDEYFGRRSVAPNQVVTEATRQRALGRTTGVSDVMLTGPSVSVPQRRTQSDMV